MTDYIVRLMGRHISPDHVSALSNIARSRSSRFGETEWLGLPPARAGSDSRFGPICVRLRADVPSDSLSPFQAACTDFADSAQLDIDIQPDSVSSTDRKLIVLDMDSTLIGAEVIDELAKLAGVGEQVTRITESAMRGEIDFKQSFRRRVALLHGLETNRISQVLEHIPLTEGAERLVSTLKQMGWKTAIVSGGFTFVAEHLQQKLGFDYVYANRLETSNGLVTGEVNSKIIDATRKAELLKKIADFEEITLDQVVAIGDGANDLAMLDVAGLGIAFHAKPVVKASARHAISHLGLDAVLFLVGIECPLPSDAHPSRTQ